ncbi:dynamin family protein [Defluviimonas sp. WL0024]|uniref:Dynamin family protein n=1 Tax=Albidovulum salinarum TaxID=2984153 RepID=A0ABT2X1S6_9RHOB|nr:dynamin family protein [Defluviimonas sp. WL0024]MCU9847890.1 dynamin family protein [Defluviimonas sp. WL0024]
MTDSKNEERREVTAEWMSRLEGWASRKPCIALMGEFSAGKTTLVNFLLGEDVLPTRVTATQLPPVWMSYGEPSAHYVDTEGQHHELSISDLHDVPVEGVRYIRLFCRGRILETIDLIDTPGISDPSIPRHIWEIAVGYVNAILWCTHSTQAWRETERSAFESLPERLRAGSVLLATRSDKLTAPERARVAGRLRREAGDLFRQVVMFSATDAIKASGEDEASDLWASSGAQDLLDALQEVAHDIADRRKDMLSRYEVVETSATKRPAPLTLVATSVDDEGAPSRLHVLPSRVGGTIRPMRPEAQPRARLSSTEANTLRTQMLVTDTPDGATKAPEAPAAMPLMLKAPIRPVEEEASGEGKATADQDDTDEAFTSAPEEAIEAYEDEASADSLDDVDLSWFASSTTEPEETTAASPPPEDSELSTEKPAETATVKVEGAPDHDKDDLPGSVALWREIVARSPQIETVPEVLGLIEEFLRADDARRRREAASAERAAEDSAGRTPLRLPRRA